MNDYRKTPNGTKSHLRNWIVALTLVGLLVGQVVPASAAPTPYAVVGPQGGSLMVLTPAGPKRLVPFAHAGSTFGVAIAADGDAYVADGGNGQFLVLSLKSGHILGRQTLPKAAKAATILSPDGNTVYAVGFGYVRAFSAHAPYAMTASLAGKGGMAAAVTHDGRTLYVAGLNRPGIDVYDTGTRQLVTTLAPKQRFVGIVLAGPNENQLWAFSPVSGDVMVYSAAEGKLLKTLHTGESGFSPANMMMATSGFMQAATTGSSSTSTIWASTFSGHLRSYDTATLSAGKTIDLTTNPTGKTQFVSMAVSPGGGTLFATVENAATTLEISASSGKILHDFGPASGTSRFTVVPESAVQPSDRE